MSVDARARRQAEKALAMASDAMDRVSTLENLFRAFSTAQNSPDEHPRALSGKPREGSD